MTSSVLIADIGGTNARFGIVDRDGLHDLLYLECRDYTGPKEAITAYLQKAGRNKPDIAILAVAGPAEEDLIGFTSIPWAFRKSTLQQDMGFKNLIVINDFHAVAWAVANISPDLLQHIGGESPVAQRPRGVVGPGTGLGAASLFWDGHEYSPQPGEGGHVTMPAITEREFQIFQQLRVKYHHISAERVCSGKGLENLYNAIRALDNKHDRPDRDAPAISAAAINGECDICQEALDLMCGFLGRIMGNLALTLNAQGGMYIAGGIPVKLGEHFLRSRFLEEFQSKGRFKDYMKRIPVYLVKHDAIGLLGLEQQARHYLD
ncbi:MAG: glucokinase [Micavibrio sp.]